MKTKNYYKNPVSFLAILLMMNLGVLQAQVEYYTGEAEIQFFGYSNVHDFQCLIPSSSLEAIISKVSGKTAKSLSLKIEVPVLPMRTGNRKRDSRMRKMFSSKNFPLIQGELKHLHLSSLLKIHEKEEPFEIVFKFKIRNQERVIRGIVESASQDPGRLNFKISFVVSLKDFDLKAPSALFGMVRVKDRVDVKTFFHLKQTENPNLSETQKTGM